MRETPTTMPAVDDQQSTDMVPPSASARLELYRNIALVVQIFAIGPLVGSLLMFLRATDGGPGVTPLLNSTPVVGAIIGAAILLAACVVGLIDAKLFGTRSGLAGAGVILAWGAWHTARTEDLLRVYPRSQIVSRGVFEALIAAIVIVWLVNTMARMAMASAEGSGNAPIPQTGLAALTRPHVLLAAFASLVAAGVVGWLVAFHGAKGQTLFAGAMGGIAAGAASAIVSAGADHSSASDHRPVDPVLPAVLGMAVLGVLTPLSMLVFHASPFVANLPGGFRLAQMHAFDWAQGALIGIPVGLGWAGAHAQGAVPRSASAPA